jgi:hypothetical protein
MFRLRGTGFMKGVAEQSHGTKCPLPCDVRTLCGDRDPIVPPKRLIERIGLRETNILLSEGNQKRAAILSNVSQGAQANGDSVRRHPCQHTRSLRHNIVGQQQ